MNKRIVVLLVFMLLLSAQAGAKLPGDPTVLPADQAIAKVSKSAWPLPPELVSLPTYNAEFFVELSDDKSIPAEGPAFDRDGNLYVTTIAKGKIFKVTPDKKVSVIYDNKATKTTSCAFHKDGRLFVIGTDNNIWYQNLDGTGMTKIETRYNGEPNKANDLIFDALGNLYVTDSDGTAANSNGGVYRFNADFTQCVPVVQGLAMPNGICLSPDEKVLWVTESGRNALLRFSFQADGVTLNMFDGFNYAYYGTGAPGGTDGVRTDSAGNVYDAIQKQGRILILNPNGMPIANVLVPGRDKGDYADVANVTIKPGTNEGYIVVGGGTKGPAVFKFKTVAKALKPFSHQ